MIEARVSHIEAFRRWLLNEETTVDDLVRYITTDEPSEAMLAGTAFHKALEMAQLGEYEALSANGFTFLLPDAELALPTIRELRAHKNYGEITISGQVDVLDGKRIEDHKTTKRFNAEGYLEGIQWKLYLDIFEADTFRWNVFEIKETDPRVYQVSPPHYLTMHRYPGIGDDVEQALARFVEFARVHLPEKIGKPEPEPFINILAAG